MTLHIVENDTGKALFCGPHAMAAVTGISPAGIIAHALAMREAGGGAAWGGRKRRTRDDHVKLMDIRELADMALKLGFACRFTEFGKWTYPLSIYCSNCRHEPGQAGRIVRISGHFLAVSSCGKWVSDTYEGLIRAERKLHHLRARITHDIIISC